jgi:predicted nucleic acid binding AN1-type Zn finger protein
MDSNQSCCKKCMKSITIMSFHCKFCEQDFCIKHQLPEKHRCDIRNSPYYDEYKLKSQNIKTFMPSSSREVNGTETC